MRKTALVTGGCGFVGRNFCKRLVDDGYKVLCVDNLISSSSLHPDNWPEHLKCNVHFINIDCLEFFKDASYHSTHFKLILHLAAIVEGRVMIETNPIAVAHDLSIDAQFFEWVVTLQSKPGKVIYFSSSAAYPIKHQVQSIFRRRKLKESMIGFEKNIGMPDMTYGFAKLTGEYLAKLAYEKYGVNIVCYRPFSGYGPDQHETYPFPAILQRVLNKETPIDIWSNSVRDFVHINDVVDCVMDTMHMIDNGSSLNIGTGKATTFKELAELMCNITNHKTSINILNDKPKGVFYRVSNNTNLKLRGWKRKLTLEQGIKQVIELRKK